MFEKDQANHPINDYGKPAPHGKGLGAKGTEKFKPMGGNAKGPKYGNAGGNASQQPSQSKEVHSKPGEEDKSMDAGDHLWKHKDSIGLPPNTPK